MSSSEHTRDRKVRRKINPATASTEELLNHLAVDPAEGLSPKEAERRLAASSAAPLYRLAARRYSVCLAQTLREPALLWLLFVAFISLFFDRVTLGLVCLLLAGGSVFLTAYLAWRTDRTDAAFSAYDTPLCRVLRGRRIHRVGASEVTRGDILLLHPGDLIPADCRLLRTEGFAVTERELSPDPHSPSVYLEKDANALPEIAGNYRTSPVNMVFAGGICEAGFAIAVVVAVGSETHLGGLTGGLRSPRIGKSPRFFAPASRVLSIYNLGMIVLVLVLTAAGIFTIGERYELLDILLSAFALASVALSGHILGKGLYLNAAVRRSAAVARDTANTADVKSAAAAEDLAQVTDVLLLGTAALHDGENHPAGLLVGDTLYRCDRPEADDEARDVAELFYLFRHGLLAFPSAGSDRAGSVPTDTLVTLADSLADWAEIDTDALLVRAKEIRTEADGISAVLPFSEGNRRVTVTVTADFEAARACSQIRVDGLFRPITEVVGGTLYRAYREAVRTGHRTLFLMTRTGSETVLRGMLTYAPHICRKTAGAIKSLETAGIRIAAFLWDESDVSLCALSECGLTEALPVHNAAKDPTPASELLDQGVRAFCGCDAAYVRDAISALKNQGRTVAVLSVEQEDSGLLKRADVAVTCSLPLFATAEAGHPRVTVGASDRRDLLASSDGLPDSPIASDLCRRRADVVVRRTASDGGGVLGLRHALLSAEHIRTATGRVFGFVLLSQAARLCLTVLPLLLGFSMLSAPALLLSGLWVDLLVLISAATLPLPPAVGKRGSMGDEVKLPHIRHKSGLIAVGVSTVLPVLAATVCHYCHVETGGEPADFLLLCLLGLQIALYRLAPLPRHNSAVFFTTLAMVLLYVAVLAASLASGLSLLWALVIPVSAPLLYVACKAILDRVAGKRATKG